MVQPGFCRCGCGGRTAIATRNEYRRGHVKGEPLPWLPGHSTNRRSLEERFWDKVDKDGPNGCWIWTGSRDHRGYGRIQRGERGLGAVKAHRLSYAIAHGTDLEDRTLFVCHRCDNPSCVNPDHLFLGTHQENVDDCKSKDRFHKPGTAADPEAVVAHYHQSGNQDATARHFGISQTTVHRYARRVSR